MRRSVSFAMLYILLLFQLANAQFENINPTLISSLTAQLSREGRISSTAGELYGLSINLAVPQDTGYQHVALSIPPEAKITKEGGNQVVRIYYDKSFRSYSYSISANISSVSRYVHSLPTSYSAKEAGAEYLAGTEHIIITPEIHKQARAVTAGYKEDIDKIAALAVWVNSYVSYDINEMGKNRNSSDVMSNPRGVCVEFTNLFIALARSLGYPSRSVLGYVYSPKYGWQLHSWAEVYIGEWVGVDPTWLEVGYIDATHIPMYFSNDTSAELIERARAMSHSEYGNMVWEGRGALGGSTEDIVVLNYTKFTPSYRVYTLPAQLAPGDDGAIIIEIDSVQYQLFSAQAVPCESEAEIIRFDDSSINLLVHPGKNYVIIPFKVSQVLSNNYQYYCPVWISHSFGSDKIPLSISSGQKTAKKFSAILSKYDQRKAELKLVSITPKNLTVVKDRGIDEVYASPQLAKQVTVDLSDGLTNSILVYDGVHVQVIRLPTSTPAYSNTIYKVDNLSLTTSIPSDGTGRFTATFQVTGNTTYNIRVYIDGKEVFYDNSSAPSYVLDYNIPLSPGSHKLKLVANFYTETYTYEGAYEVFEPVLTVAKESSDGREYKFAVYGPYIAYAVYVDGVEVKDDKGTLLETGEHVLSVVWIDKAGIEREHEEKFYVDGIPGGDVAKACAVLGVLVAFSFILVYINSRKKKVYLW
ncbi:MAG: transglutaminase-like domain-containing protein [Candidatus Micrarchaeia archaeon]